MFNVKISLLYFLLITLIVVSLSVTVGQSKTEAVVQAETALKSMPGMLMVRKELRERRLRDFADRVGNSPLAAALVALHEFRRDFIEVDRYICSPETGVKCDLQHPSFSSERARIAEKRYGQTTFKRFSDRLTALNDQWRPGWSKEERAAFSTDATKTLQDCFGRGSAQCDWRFTHDALMEVLDATQQEQGGAKAVGADIVLVFDSTGSGIANSNNDDWSYRREYVDLVGRLRTFIAKSDTRGLIPVYHDLLKFEETGQTEYLATMVPIMGADNAFLGAVLVGESITGKLVEKDKSVFGKEVTYILNDKPVASTMANEDYKFMLASTKVDQRLKRHLVKSEDWLGISLPSARLAGRSPGESDQAPTFIGGVAYGPRYQMLRVVLATEREDWAGALTTLQRLLPLFGLATFLIGVILFSVLIRNHMQPFEAIDSGLHEVINGNFDYQFPFDYSEELPSSMAQSLNLMVAVLLGKPLPEDEASSVGDWDATALAAGGLGQGLMADVDLTIVEEPDDDPASAAASNEAAESYYRRIYQEYQGLRVANGQQAALSFVRFVEHLSASERRLSDAFGCAHVRFRVVSQGGQVVLIPSPLYS